MQGSSKSTIRRFSSALLPAASIGCRRSGESNSHDIFAILGYSRLELLRHQLLATQKWLVSFLGSADKWQLEDYPVILWHHDNSDFRGHSRLKPVEWVASIVRWGIAGTGDSRPEAIEQLRANIEREREEKGALPRPGTRVPIELASQEQISRYWELEEDFVTRVLQLDGAWMSDESSLWDFHGEEDNGEYYRRIKEVYGVDVSDVPGALIAAILAKIAENRLKRRSAASPESRYTRESN
jgi:hypothetical protein